MRYITSFILFLISSTLIAGGIRGTIKSNDGELLPYTTIYVKETGSGTTTNADAYYELNLTPGDYTVVFQFVGYNSLTKIVRVGDDWVDLNVTLDTQTILLKDVEVRAGKEDPAYTIMRKAIAKSKFHVQQVDSYTAKVYLKGTGQLLKAPFFLRKKLKEEGVDEDRVFVSESVNEIEYKRPNTYNEKVVSIRSSGDDQGSNPSQYINGSFYEPEVAGGVSPLSPRAFSYYRFVYDGTYSDQGFEISRIKVIPRSRGDNVFAGTMEIVEDYWSIYTLNLKTSKLGINFEISQVYEPIESNVWLPVTHKFKVDGKVLGFQFEGNYLAGVSDYKVVVNPDLDVEIEVIDEKVDKELAGKLKKQTNQNEEASEIQQILTSGKEVTRKQLRKVIKEYEKLELKQTDEPEVISNRSFEVDSLAHNSDSVYWASIRPIPLSSNEVRGYQISDSIAVEDQKLRDGDTTKVNYKRKGFSILDIPLGRIYKVGDRAHFSLKGVSGQFNTVDGFNIDYGMEFTKTFENKNWLRLISKNRYAIARERYNGTLEARYDFGPTKKRNTVRIVGGRYTSQFNSDEPIHPLVNTLITLFNERNFMKIYEKDFLSFKYNRTFFNKLSLRVDSEIAQRRQLFNNSKYRLIDKDNRSYTPNLPASEELPDPSFEDHRTVTAEVRLSYKPWQKFSIYNGTRQPIKGSSPTFDFTYHKGFNALGSKVDFDLLELGYRHTFDIGIRGQVDISVKAGKFLNNREVFFMDYQHFMGNKTLFTTADPVGSFRLLDYYRFSTKKEYLMGTGHYLFRKFLITRLPMVRLLGVREGFFVGHLQTDISNHYTELGYGINYIFRFLRVEAVTSFENGKYKDFGIRLGVGVDLDDLFN